MSVRLNVLLVQAARSSPLREGIGAELAMQLMGVPGLDLAIVSSLAADDAAETDRLLLGSFANDLAVIDWCDAGAMLEALAALGVSGRRAPHRLDPSVPAVSPGERRLYLIDLRRGDSPDAVVAALRALLSDRRVVAVPLLAAGAKQKPAAPSAGTSANGDMDQPSNTSAAGGQAAAHPTAGARSPSANPLNPESRPGDNATGPASSTHRRPGESDLDALVDGVNDAQW